MTRHRNPSRLAAFFGSALAGALLLAGCASTAPEAADTPGTPEGLLPPAEGAVEYPLTLESPFGDTVLTERPERIAAVHPTAADTELLLALGVTPILSSGILSNAVYLEELGSEDIDTFEFVAGEPLPVEAIAASKPDLIVAVGWNLGTGGTDLADNIERLRAIAPVLTNATDPEVPSPWQESIRVLGEALDLTDEAEGVIAQNEAFFDTLREDNADFPELTTSWALWYGSDWGPLSYWSVPGTPVSAFVGELGLRENPNGSEFVDEPKVSDENLSLVDADLLVIAQKSDDEDFATLTERELFQSLNAVKSGRFVSFTDEEIGGNLAYAIATGGPLSREWAAQQVVPLIRAVL